jgi:hypothetical protein
MDELRISLDATTLHCAWRQCQWAPCTFAYISLACVVTASVDSDQGNRSGSCCCHVQSVSNLFSGFVTKSYYPVLEVVHVNSMCGCANGNSLEAHRLRTEYYPQRKILAYKVFSKLHPRLSESVLCAYCTVVLVKCKSIHISAGTGSWPYVRWIVLLI